MIPELGHFALWLALGISLVLGTLPMLGAARNRSDWMALARPCARFVFGLVAFAFACLALAFIGSDFSVLYVAENSNRSLPMHYRFTAVWGGHEGSILLWLLMLTFWTFAVSLFSRHLPEKVVARILAVMGWLAFGFLLFILLTSNPFDRLSPVPADGRDLNPLLQDPGMVIHPPMLYMGYVGLSVAFSFAIAALIGGNLDATWARWTRPWTTAAWIFLTIGIALGSGWSYYVLGWGGWWFWDPVENASFMPWLVATALIHSLAVTEKRNSFKNWTVLLAILAFSLSLLGTFLVRSGVLSSVHAFATDPRRGLFILAFLVIVIGASLTLYAWRATSVGLGARFALLSRETLLLGNNVLLVVACGAVLLGTLYPLALDALGLGKISVGPPYFDTVFVPLLTPLVFLMGVGPLARWKETQLPDLAHRLRWAAGASIVATVIVAWLQGGVGIVGALGLLMAAWIVASVATDLVERLRPVGGLRASILHRARLVPRAMVGMMVAHLGIAVFIFGVTMVKTGDVERDVKMDVGDTTEIHGNVFTFRGVREVAGPNYQAVQGRHRHHPRRQAADDPATGEALLSVDAVDDDRSLDRQRRDPRSLRLARRADRRRHGLDRARLLQALRRLDLGRLLHHGPGRLHRRHRPALSRQGEAVGDGARRERGGGMKRLWFLIPLAAFFALAAILAQGLKLDPHEVPSPLIDKPAPAFALTRLDDATQTIRLADMRGKVWMLNVWASWCVSCREEHPLLVEFSKKHVVPIYGLDYKDQRTRRERLAGALRQPLRRLALRRRRPRRHRLRRLRRARDLHHRPERRHPDEAHRPPDPRSAGDEDRALPRKAEEARCLRPGCSVAWPAQRARSSLPSRWR